MKNTLHKLTALTLLITALGFSAQAQTASSTIGKASINTDLVIMLDTQAQLVADYTFDISGIAFKDKATTEQFFKSIHDNLVSYEVNYDLKTVKVHLMLEYVAPRDWKLEDWNKYFNTVSKRYVQNYEAINNGQH